MLKVLIVDDEPMIREGLKSIIDWNKYGFTVCGEAENGSQGLRLIKELNTDIAIVDIKMPEMDGLQMVEELRKSCSSCKIVFLTAFSDFKFAQKAIELGVESYILKPIEELELIEKVCKIRDEIINKRLIEKQFDANLMLSREKTLENIVLGQAEDETIECCNIAYGLNFPWRSYHIILVEMEKKFSEALSLRVSVKKEINTFLEKRNYGWAFDIGRYIGLIFKNLSYASYPRVLLDLQTTISNYFKIDITISMGTTVTAMEDIPLSYKRACELMERKFIYGHKKILMDQAEEYDNLSAIVQSMEKFELDTVVDTLYSAIDVNNMDYINKLLEDIKDLFVLSNETEESIKTNYSNLYVILINKLKIDNGFLKESIGSKKEIIDQILSKTSLQELHGFIKFRLVSISDEIQRHRPAAPMKKVLDYIDRNYNTDLKLESIAALFNYNSSYMGKLFKTEIGECFNTYIDRIRLKKAKQLLKEGFKVYQVAEKLGYKDIDYFYKKFKKYNGMSPSEYKET